MRWKASFRVGPVQRTITDYALILIAELCTNPDDYPQPTQVLGISEVFAPEALSGDPHSVAYLEQAHGRCTIGMKKAIVTQSGKVTIYLTTCPRVLFYRAPAAISVNIFSN